ncbi:helix-turn-helix domain-containing protein [uncultured Enterococcus sp.]|uniref:helix-turn-helix domain-containing protein n=1 Tax=uncultured Enterococcus sp. TaxID=167972 RepID=UPI00259883D9|nr:helix-turn-helix transcriptional regulator [uncultured Enterococcus sp.]
MKQNEKIRQLRVKQGFTQKELGERSGIGESTIRKYELGQRNPKLETLNKIASALGVSASSLLDDKENSFSETMYKRNFNSTLSLIEEVNLKISSTGSIVKEIIEEGYLWIDTPDSSFEITQKELEELNEKLESYAKFAINELEQKHK